MYTDKWSDTNREMSIYEISALLGHCSSNKISGRELAVVQSWLQMRQFKMIMFPFGSGASRYHFVVELNGH